MIVSTRGRYALRVMIDLAENGNGEFLPMKDVAARQGISHKYLEQILPVLTKNGLVQAVHGKGGGYKILVKPEECTVGMILRLTEGELTAVACLEDGAPECEKKGDCRTIGLWSDLNKAINNLIDSYTLADLMKK